MDKEFIERLVGAGETAEAILQAHQQVVQGYEDRIRAMGVSAALQQAVTAAGGRNLTAIRALMDEKTIAESADPAAAAASAVEQVKRENPYLFASAQVVAPGTGSNIPAAGYTQEDLARMSLAEYRRYRRGQ